MANYNRHLMNLISNNKNMAVPWYLIASYTYYQLDNPILTDNVFDTLAKFTLKHYDNIIHRHKVLITKDMLAAGTYFGEYPSIVKGSARSLILNKTNG